jgi:hypothetical protein
MSFFEVVKLTVMVIGSAVIFIFLVFGVGGVAILLLQWALRKK